MEILNAFGNELSWTETVMQTLRKSKSRLVSVSAGPRHVLFTPKRTFPNRTYLCSRSWSRDQSCLPSLPSGAGRKHEQNLVPKQGMGLANKECTPLHQLSMAWENCLLSFSLPLGFFYDTM